MPTAREHLTSSGVNGKVYSSGGRSNGMYFNVDSNEVYDLINKWATRTNAFKERSSVRYSSQ